MSTVVIATTITGKINGRSVSIQLTNTIEDVSYVLERNGRLPFGGDAQSLELVGTDPPQIDNAQLCYMRFDTYAGAGASITNIETNGSGDPIVVHTLPGEYVEFHRSDAGGIAVQNTTATTSVLEELSIIQQTTEAQSTLSSMIAVFKPLS